ncbi:Transmembrane protein [Phytophthora cinnamomi]|uniref:Transmembrane protein n=1 Tax=Phytophthora cinnamomi TaxID=4785 RepID=UPI00355A96A0|nr:Transmembrane protein [Phytophthora cinnamomi]
MAEGAPTASLLTFYPNYIDDRKTVQQGRRVPQLQACEAPLADEMSEVCTFLQLPHVLEPAKKYPRDWLCVGLHGRAHPQLQSRKLRLEREADEAKKKAAAAAGAATASSGGGKKKGKKKGRR